MKKLAGIAAALSMMASPAIAQIQDSSTEATEALPLSGGEVIVEPELTEFDDWTLTCVKTDEGTDSCIIQQIVQNEQSARVAIIDIFKVDDDAVFEAGAAIVVPLGVSLAEGVSLKVDSSLERRYQYTICINDGCVARIGLTPEDVQRMKNGREMEMSVYVGITADRRVELQISLIGFTKAYDAL